MPDQPDFSANLRRLSDSAWAYAALATAIELGVLDCLDAPIPEVEVATRCDVDPLLVADLVEVLVGLGAVERDGTELRPGPGLELLSGPTASRVWRGEVRSDHLQIRSLLHEARAGREPLGWSHEDPVTLSAQGDTGGLFGLLTEALAPGLEGLVERLEAEDGFRVLDVGAGVGVISTELCRAWPNAVVVGLEPHRTAREIGRSRIAADGLADRIELRDQRLEDLREREAFDLVFLPQPFLSLQSLAGGLPAALSALRPGGWLLALVSSLECEDPLAAAGRRFRARAWGGGVISATELADWLTEAGFEPARIGYPVGSFRTVCARRPPTAAAAASSAGGRGGSETASRAG